MNFAQKVSAQYVIADVDPFEADASFSSFLQKTAAILGIGLLGAALTHKAGMWDMKQADKFGSKIEHTIKDMAKKANLPTDIKIVTEQKGGNGSIKVMYKVMKEGKPVGQMNVDAIKGKSPTVTYNAAGTESGIDTEKISKMTQDLAKSLNVEVQKEKSPAKSDPTTLSEAQLDAYAANKAETFKDLGVTAVFSPGENGAVNFAMSVNTSDKMEGRAYGSIYLESKDGISSIQTKAHNSGMTTKNKDAMMKALKIIRQDFGPKMSKLQKAAL